MSGLSADELAWLGFEFCPSGIFVCDSAGRMVAANHAFLRMSGCELVHLLGEPPTLLTCRRSGRKLSWDQFWKRWVKNDQWQGVAILERRDASQVKAWLQISWLELEGQASAMAIGVLSERAVGVELERRIRYQAGHDPLTGLANRWLLMDRVDNALERAGARGARVGLLFLDLDRFKRVNDQMGHMAGDAALREVARALRGCVRRGDTVGRLGGDEFLVLLDGVEGEAAASHCAGRIVERFREPMRVDGAEVRVGASIGIALYPEDGEDSSTLIRCADQALYEAKRSGGGAWRFFHSGGSNGALSNEHETEPADPL